MMSTSAVLKQTEHFHPKVENLAFCGSRICPSTLALLTVEVEAIALLICMLSPLRDLFVDVDLHLLHLHLQLMKLLLSLL